MLDPVAVVAGGRVRIELPASLAVELLTVTSTEGVTATIEEGGVAISVRAGYQSRDASLALACAHGEITVPVAIAPLRMVPLTTWTSSESAPAAREYFAWWIDPSDADALLLYGGFVYQPRQFTPSSEMWRFDLAALAWSRVSVIGDPPPPGGRVAPGRGSETLYFGGATLRADGSLATPPTLMSVAIDGDSARFTAAPSITGAPGSYTGAFVHDTARDRWLSVCGVDTSSPRGLHCDVDVYTPERGFERLDVEGEPPPGRYGFHHVYDAETDRVIVFGGQIGPANLDIAGDTWALELAPDGDASRPRWTRLFDDAPGISRRRNGAYALDPEGHRLFVWGGTPDGATSVPGLDVLSLDRGTETWTHVDLPEDVPPRTSGAGIYDPVRHRILWGLGNDDALYTDLHALELAVPGDA
jgi:hypothetical protein